MTKGPPEEVAICASPRRPSAYYGVRIWRASDGAPLITLNQHRHFVQQAAYSPDGRFLATGGWDPRNWGIDDMAQSPQTVR